MKKEFGSKTIGLIECINPMKNKWKLRWNVQEVDENNVSYEETDFDHKPLIEEIKKVILDWHNQEIDKKILSSFVWNDMPVWLSSENQFNFKAAYDLAFQTEGATLPVEFKLGTDEEPVFHTFYNMDDFGDFYMKSLAYIQSVLNAGWRIKKSVDWTLYMVD